MTTVFTLICTVAVILAIVFGVKGFRHKDKRKKLLCLVMIALAVVSALLVPPHSANDTLKGDPSVIQKEETEQDISTPDQTDSPDTDEEETQTAAETEPSADGAEIERGKYTLPCGMVLNFSPSVRNDVTGRWRISTTSDSLIPADYALEYYNALFSADDEIHAIWNATLNTTTRITVSGGMLYVDTLEYVDGEEHDAKILFSGELLDSKVIEISTGKDITAEDGGEDQAPEAEPTPEPAQVENQTPTQKSEQEQKPEPVPEPEQEPEPEQKSEPEPETEPVPTTDPYGHVIYGTEYGKKYHYDNSCNGGNYFEITWQEAQRRELGPCEKCVLH